MSPPGRAGTPTQSAERFASAPDGTPLLEVADIRTHFRTGAGLVRAVDGVTFSLERGRTIGIVGESGSGKTVLSRSIMGLLPKHNVVRDGSIRFDGQELIHASNEDMRRLWGTQMAMVFQDPMTSLNPVMRIGRQIIEPLRYHLDITKDYARETAVALLASVGIPEPERRMRQYPHEMSGGMRQRVMIAIAISCGPKLLFADEPTTALDVTVQAQILDLLQSQQTERFMAMVLVTHDLGVVAGRADEIAVMYAGQIVEKAPTRALFADLKMPYTEALLQSIPKLDDPSHTVLATIGGRPPNLVNPPPGCRFSPRCGYAQPKCFVEMPPLTAATTPGHEFRCWFPVGTPQGRAAWEANHPAPSGNGSTPKTSDSPTTAVSSTVSAGPDSPASSGAPAASSSPAGSAAARPITGGRVPGSPRPTLPDNSASPPNLPPDGPGSAGPGAS